jgi:2-hydroxychromene-2-carboxylate isomerase
VADLDFFFDPMCPWAWITSRWVVETQQLRDYDINWRFISLAVINEQLVADWYTPEYRAGHVRGLHALRVADALRLTDGNEAVGRFYTAVGTAIHPQRRAADFLADASAFMRSVLTDAGCDPEVAAAMDDESHDEYIRAETALAFERTGKDVGTPILTFAPGTDREGSFFGPVISTIPRGDHALRLWDAVETLATSGVAELKRSNRSRPIFD